MQTSLSMRHAAGYTMTELAMVMTIMGILAGIGLPSFRYVTTSNRVSSEINGLLGDMQFARSQAIKQGQTVTIFASAAPYTACSGSTSWDQGWIVCLDPTQGQQCAGLPIIRVQPKFNASDTLVSSVAYSAASYNRMGYAPTGQVNTFTINLHDPTNTSAWTRCLAVTPAGSVSTEQYGAGTPQCT
jgi:type IV fimbrial biogenesis protein FimT